MCVCVWEWYNDRRRKDTHRKMRDHIRELCPSIFPTKREQLCHEGFWTCPLDAIAALCPLSKVHSSCRVTHVSQHTREITSCTTDISFPPLLRFFYFLSSLPSIALLPHQDKWLVQNIDNGLKLKGIAAERRWKSVFFFGRKRMEWFFFSTKPLLF